MKTATVPVAALIIKWPLAASVPAAREAARRLLTGRTPATWSLDQASQVESLAGWGAGPNLTEATLIVPTAADAAGTTEQAASNEVARRLDLLRSAGVQVDLVHGSGAMTEGHWPRTLRALGVHGMVAETAQQDASARALPFGVWQFTPHAIVPRVRRWTDWLMRRTPLFAGRRHAPTVATIDLARIGAAGSRTWREMEVALEQAAEAVAGGAVRLASLGELTMQFTQASAPRPQRSILRAA